MKSNSLFLSILGALYAGVFLTCTAAFAQTTPEEQAKTVLQLFESGQKDSAYALLEPLKKSARFVPAVIFTRAQMTPDDRALGLYKEIMALEPEGQWAEKSAYQLVARYADKRDSLAAHIWAGVLRANYARSPLVASADKLLAETTSWRSPEEDVADATAGKKPGVKESAPRGKATPAAVASKPTGKAAAAETRSTTRTTPAKPATATVAVGKTTVSKPAATKTAAATDTYKSTGLNGYALQVGVFPSKELAQARSTELRNRKIRSYALPKPSAGKGFYAVVVGPYATKEEANKKKPVVDGLCGCDSFRVEVK
jgi:cell division septation protein DedD